MCPPLYDYSCETCNALMTMYNSVEKRDKGPKCTCGGRTKKVILPAQVMPDISPYKSMIDGSIINSRNKHRQHLRDHNCTEVGNEKMGNSITPAASLSREQRKEDIRKAIAQLRNR